MGTETEQKQPESPVDGTDEDAEGGRVKWLEPGDVRLFRDEAGHVRATVRGDRSVVRPAVVRAFPVTAPDRLIELREEQGDSVGMLRELSGLDETSRQVAGELLRERYLVPVIREIRGLRRELGLWIWEVVTDRGERTFSMKSPRDDVRRLPGGCLRIADMDGNTFEVREAGALDPRSRQLLDKVI